MQLPSLEFPVLFLIMALALLAWSRLSRNTD